MRKPGINPFLKRKRLREESKKPVSLFLETGAGVQISLSALFIIMPLTETFSLADLSVLAPSAPTMQWDLNGRDWEEYRVRGSVADQYVGRLTITRALNLADRESDAYFFDLSQSPPVPKPFVSYQETAEDFRGRGICGHLITEANEFYRGALGTPLYSDTIFVESFETQSKRVWQKLAQQGLAEFKPHNGKDRWRMR